jgi:hypothetical protein
MAVGVSIERQRAEPALVNGAESAPTGTAQAPPAAAQQAGRSRAQPERRSRLEREASAVIAPTTGVVWYALALGMALIIVYWLLQRRSAAAVSKLFDAARAGAQAWMNPAVDPIAALHKTLGGGETSSVSLSPNEIFSPPSQETIESALGGARRRAVPTRRARLVHRGVIPRRHRVIVAHR